MLRTWLILMLLPAAASAQTLRRPAPPPSDVFIAMSALAESGVVWIGPQIAATLRVSPRVGIVGDLTLYNVRGYRYSSAKRLTFDGGVRVYGPTGKTSLFGQFLIGTTPFAFVAMFPGFGVDAQIGKRTAIRGVFDIKISGDEQMFYGSRFVLGAVVKLGQE